MILPTQTNSRTFEISKLNYLIYGLPKVGKSSYAAQFENALFLATEEGLNFLDVFKISIRSWEDLLEAGKALAKGPHSFKMVVVDTADILFKQCEQYVMKQYNLKNPQANAHHPSDLPYGKGFSLVKDEFSRVIHGINKLGLGLCFISHAKEREMKTKNETWTLMDSTLSGSAAGVISGAMDFILYFYVGSDGKRYIRTKPTKHINAGDRSGKLPEIMPLEFKYFQKAFQALDSKQPNKGE